MVKAQSRGLLPTTRPLLPRRLQLPVALRVDRGLPTPEHVVRRYVPNRAVQPDMVIVVHILLNQAFRVFQRQWRSLPNAFPFQRLVPAFQFSVRLRIVRRGADVRHARDANELLEVASDELRPIVRDDPCARSGSHAS